MQRRLLVPMVGLMVVVLLALGIPLAGGQARAVAKDMFLDRLGDATRFAAVAQQESQDAQERPLERELRRYQDVYGISAALLDRNGDVLAASNPDFRVQAADSDWLDAAVSGRRPDPPSEIWPWSSDPLIVAEPVIDGGDVVGVIVISSPTATARALVGREWVLIGVGITLAMVVCAMLAVLLTRWILRPVRLVDRVAHDIATGELTARVPVEQGPAELRRLSSSFNEMADSVAGVVEQQRAFVADASHQLRNQLHALMLRLDGITMTLPAEYAREANRAADEGRRLAAMLEQLLELAKAEHLGDGRHQRLELSALVDDRIRAWEPAAAARRIRLRRCGDDSVRVDGDEVAVIGATDVLLDNAIKFSPDGATVTVTLAAGPEAATITVTDQGRGLDPDELGRAGGRFWRSRRHQNVPGSGLGLSIARTLLASSGAEVEVTNAPEGGLRVTLHLPTRPRVSAPTAAG